MPVYYHPGQSFTKISSFSTNRQTTEDYHGCAQGDYWQAAAGTCVAAASAGTVFYVGNEAAGFGHYIVIEHELKATKQKIYTIYAHLNAKPTLVKGQQVQRGDIVGYVGNSGKTQNTQSNGMFFHFEIRKNDYWLANAKHKDELIKQGLIADPSTFDLSMLEGFTEEIEKTQSTCTACLFKAITQPEPELAPEPETTTPQAEPASDAKQPATQPTSQIGGEHPCTSGKLTIQVTGFGHKDKPQKLYFYEQALDQPKIVDTEDVTQQNAKSQGPIYGASDCPSTLFNWQECSIANLKLGLQIDKEQGEGKIYLPLADKVESNNNHDKIKEYKYNQLIAFVPLAIHNLPRRRQNYFTADFKQPHNADVTPYGGPATSLTKVSDTLYAPAREGYLYIFYQDKLWREILIKQDAKGKNTYKDVDLQVHRTANGHFKIDVGCQYKTGQAQSFNYPIPALREAEGATLEEIWIPHKISGKKLTVKLMYSEDQLSGERLNLIEQALSPTTSPNNTNQQVAKSLKLDELLTSVETNDFFFRYANGTINANSISKSSPAVRMDLLPSKRGRNTTIEWRLAYPLSYLTDITGQSLTNKYDATQKIDTLCKSEQVPAKRIMNGDFNGLTGGGFMEFEIDAWHHILEQQYSSACSPDDLWAAPIDATPTQDVLQQHKQRYILGIALPDPINELHHLQTLLDIAQNSAIFRFLSIRSNQAPYSVMGNFAYNMSYLFEDIKNTINKELSDAIKHNYNKSVSNAERTYLFDLIDRCQTKMAELLQQNSTIQAILNLLSDHQPLVYAANLNFIANCLSAISKAPIAYDPQTATIGANITEAQVTLSELISNVNHPLHQALWPKTTFEELKQEQLPEQQAQACDNNGTGLFYLPALTALKDWEQPIEQAPPIKLLMFILQGQTQLDSNLQILRNELKIGLAAIYNIVTMFTDTVTEVKKATEDEKAARDQYNEAKAKQRIAQRNADQAAQTVKTEQEKLNELNKVREEIRAEDRAARNKLSTAERKRFDLIERMNKTLDEGAKLFYHKSYLPSIAQLRQTIPQFKALRYMLSSETNIQHIALGLYTEGNLTALQELLDAYPNLTSKNNGTLLQKFKRILASTGQAIHNTATFVSDVFVLGIPKALANRKLFAAYAQTLSESFDALIEKMAIATKRSAAINDVLKQRGILARAVNLNNNAQDLLLTANNTAKEAEELLSKAQLRLANAEAQQIEFAKRYESVLRHPAIPGILFLVELWNITSVAIHLNDVGKNQGYARAFTGVVSAGVDTGFAFALFVERFNGQRAKALHSFLSAKSNSKLLKLLKLGGVEMRGLIGGGAMALTAIVSFWDAIDYYNDNNPAWIGYAMTGVGASVLMLQSFAVLAASGPIGWVILGIGVCLMLAGTILAGKLDNSNRIKEWFKRSPFGHETESTYIHLYNQQEAVLRLLNVLVNINITSEVIDQQQVTQTIKQLNAVPLTETEQQKQQRLQQLSTQYKMQKAHFKVSVRCLCANFFANSVFLPALALYRVISHATEVGINSIATNIEEPKLTQLDEHHIDYYGTGIDLYLKTEKSQSASTGMGTLTEEYLWVLQLQMQSYLTMENVSEQVRVFPTPKLEDPTVYDINIHAKTPTFPKTRAVGLFGIDTIAMDDSPYWYHQTIKAPR